eukprot:gnl/MRDRNA2_/MRDRNA2_34528_c0_seq1.p1 gnl/MRDRNA2_/MRDRNA2_34528_c0~~gnl/MRDRNA2_/MRDRNA2_34528_c0_seq1.p1  ORF type:complete len:111 (+),score=19.10 gnl/MRDRNA2_/MRDRNA2_34528_c0_seq1:2-334(+)
MGGMGGGIQGNIGGKHANTSGMGRTGGMRQMDDMGGMQDGGMNPMMAQQNQMFGIGPIGGMGVMQQSQMGGMGQMGAEDTASTPTDSTRLHIGSYGESYEVPKAARSFLA